MPTLHQLTKSKRKKKQHKASSLKAPQKRGVCVRVWNYEVVEKNLVDRPDRVTGVLECPNRSCITTADEPVESEFEILDDGVRCVYCDTIAREDLHARISV